jgi:hypothetical protein
MRRVRWDAAPRLYRATFNHYGSRVRGPNWNLTWVDDRGKQRHLVAEEVWTLVPTKKPKGHGYEEGRGYGYWQETQHGRVLVICEEVNPVLERVF